MDTLTGMRLFAEVVDAGSFSEAGRRLGLAASSVSRQVNGLEDALKARLLNRSTRSLSLTHAGEIYYERVRRILSEVAETNAAVAQLEASPRGLLRLNASVVFGRRHIAPHLAEFCARYPDVSIDLTMTDHFVDVIESGADVVIRVGGLSDSSLIARRLAPNRRVLVASQDYIDRQGAPETPEALGEHRCLVYKHKVSMAEWHIRDAAGDVTRVKVSGPLTANNAEALHSAARDGLGIALLPSWTVGRDVRNGHLIRLLPGHEADLSSEETAIHAIYPHARHLSAKVRAFVDFLVEKFKPVPYWENDDLDE
jgi:DNA-binding transcriptional LysR family regulator